MHFRWAWPERWHRFLIWLLSLTLVVSENLLSTWIIQNRVLLLSVIVTEDRWILSLLHLRLRRATLLSRRSCKLPILTALVVSLDRWRGLYLLVEILFFLKVFMILLSTVSCLLPLLSYRSLFLVLNLSYHLLRSYQTMMLGWFVRFSGYWGNLGLIA